MISLPPHPALHPVFEAAGYWLGYRVYQRARERAGDVVAEAQRWSVIAAAALGALVGSRALGLLEQAPRLHVTIAQMGAQAVMPGSGGKTIVGGLLGGWIAVECVKWLKGIRERTGDLFAVPLCVGIAVGRVGCLLAGLADDTYGKTTGLPWGVDFGDGVARHPTQAYEILFLGVLAVALRWMGRRPHRNGAMFRVFLAAYLLWRLVIDFLKPQPLFGGLNAIQWACCAGLSCLLSGALTHRPAATERVTENTYA